MPFIFLALFFVNILSDYATIRLYNEVKMPFFLAFPLSSMATMFMVIDTFPTSYRVYEASQKLIAKVKESKETSIYASKFMKSCKPLGVNVGSFFFIKQKTLMTFIGIVLENAIMMLLSF